MVKKVFFVAIFATIVIGIMGFLPKPVQDVADATINQFLVQEVEASGAGNRKCVRGTNMFSLPNGGTFMAYLGKDWAVYYRGNKTVVGGVTWAEISVNGNYGWVKAGDLGTSMSGAKYNPSVNWSTTWFVRSSQVMIADRFTANGRTTTLYKDSAMKNKHSQKLAANTRVQVRNKYVIRRIRPNSSVAITEKTMVSVWLYTGIGTSGSIFIDAGDLCYAPTLGTPTWAPSNSRSHNPTARTLDLSWTSVTSAQKYVINWSLGGQSGKVETSNTKATVKYPNVAGQLNINIYAVGSYNGYYRQSATPLKYTINDIKKVAASPEVNISSPANNAVIPYNSSMTIVPSRTVGSTETLHLNIYCSKQGCGFIEGYNEKKVNGSVTISSTTMSKHSGTGHSIGLRFISKNSLGEKTLGTARYVTVGNQTQIIPVPEHLKMPAEGGGFVNPPTLISDHGILVTTGQGHYRNILNLYIPYKSSEFLFTGDTLKQWLYKFGEQTVIDAMAGKDAALESLRLSLNLAYPCSGELVYWTIKGYDTIKTIDSLVSTLKNQANDNNLRTAINICSSNGGGFVLVDVYIYSQSTNSGLSKIYTKIEYKPLAKAYTGSTLPTKNGMTFYTMSTIRTALKNLGIDLSIASNTSTRSATTVATPPTTVTTAVASLNWRYNNGAQFNGGAVRNISRSRQSNFWFGLNSPRTSNNATLRVYYSSGKNADSDANGGRYATIYINGRGYFDIYFPNTDWQWRYIDITVSVNSGNNDVGVYWSNYSNFSPDFWKFELIM